MTIQKLTEEIFEKSYNRGSLEKLLTKEIKKKVEYALKTATTDESIQEVTNRTLKSD